MAQDLSPNRKYIKDALAAWISRTSRSNPYPLTQEALIQDHRMARYSEVPANLQENSWPGYNYGAPQTPLGSTGLSAVANPQENRGNSAAEPIEEDDDGNKISDPPPPNRRSQFQVDPHYLPNSAKDSCAENETNHLIQDKTYETINTLTNRINMVAQLAEEYQLKVCQIGYFVE